MDTLLAKTQWRERNNEMAYNFTRMTNGSLFNRASHFDISPSRTRLSTLEACAPLGKLLKDAEKAKRKETGNDKAQLTYEEYFAAILPKCFPVALYAIDVSKTDPVLLTWWLPQVEATEVGPMREAIRLQRERNDPLTDPSALARQYIAPQTSAIFTAEEATRAYIPYSILQDQIPDIEVKTKAKQSEDQEQRRWMRMSARLGVVMSDPAFAPAVVFGGPWYFEGQVDQLYQSYDKTVGKANKKELEADERAKKTAYLATCKAIESLHLSDENTPIESFEIADRILGFYEEYQGLVARHSRAPPVNFLMQNMLIAIREALDAQNGRTTPRPFVCVSKKAGLLEYMRAKHPNYYETFDPTRPASAQKALPPKERERLRKLVPVILLNYCFKFWEANPPGNVTVEQVRKAREFAELTTQGKTQGPIDIADSIMGAMAALVLHSRGKPYTAPETETLGKAQKIWAQAMAQIAQDLAAGGSAGGAAVLLRHQAGPVVVGKVAQGQMAQAGKDIAKSKVSTPAPAPAPAPVAKAKDSSLGTAKAPAAPKPSLTTTPPQKNPKPANAEPVKSTGTGLFDKMQQKLQRDKTQSPIDAYVAPQGVTKTAKPAASKPKTSSSSSTSSSSLVDVNGSKVRVVSAIRDLPRAQALAKLAAQRSKQPEQVRKKVYLESDDEEAQYKEMEREQRLIMDLADSDEDSQDEFIVNDFGNDDEIDLDSDEERKSRKRSRDDDLDSELRSVDGGKKRRKMDGSITRDDVRDFAQKHARKKNTTEPIGYGGVRGSMSSKRTWLETDQMNDDGAV